MSYSPLATRCRSIIRYDLGLLLQAKWHFHLFYMLPNYILKLTVGGLGKEGTPTLEALLNLCVGSGRIISLRYTNSSWESGTTEWLHPAPVAVCGRAPTHPAPRRPFLFSHQHCLPPNETISRWPQLATHKTTYLYNYSKCQRITLKWKHKISFLCFRLQLSSHNTAVQMKAPFAKVITGRRYPRPCLHCQVLS